MSRDGSFRLWNGADLKHFRTMTLGSAWITSGIYMPAVSRARAPAVEHLMEHLAAAPGAAGTAQGCPPRITCMCMHSRGGSSLVAHRASLSVEIWSMLLAELSP